MTPGRARNEGKDEAPESTSSNSASSGFLPGAGERISTAKALYCTPLHHFTVSTSCRWDHVLKLQLTELGNLLIQINWKENDFFSGFCPMNICCFFCFGLKWLSLHLKPLRGFKGRCILMNYITERTMYCHKHAGFSKMLTSIRSPRRNSTLKITLTKLQHYTQTIEVTIKRWQWNWRR